MDADTTREPVVVDNQASTVTIPHWGITFRVLYGAILAAWPDPQPGQRRAFTVLYHGAPIATLNVQQNSNP